MASLPPPQSLRTRRRSLLATWAAWAMGEVSAPWVEERLGLKNGNNKDRRRTTVACKTKTMVKTHLLSRQAWQWVWMEQAAPLWRPLSLCEKKERKWRCVGTWWNSPKARKVRAN